MGWQAQQVARSFTLHKDGFLTIGNTRIAAKHVTSVTAGRVIMVPNNPVHMKGVLFLFLALACWAVPPAISIFIPVPELDSNFRELPDPFPMRYTVAIVFALAGLGSIFHMAVLLVRGFQYREPGVVIKTAAETFYIASPSMEQAEQLKSEIEAKMASQTDILQNNFIKVDAHQSGSSIADEIEKLGKLKREGTISTEEFESLKADVFRRQAAS